SFDVTCEAIRHSSAFCSSSKTHPERDLRGK
ncbi:hypothetical protein CDAR_85581, partial [Caerostris darwini]